MKTFTGAALAAVLSLSAALVGAGPVPLESRSVDGLRQWSSARAVKGDLVVKYGVPVENTPLTQGGPPLSPRVDGDGFSSVGNMFLMSPRIEGPYRVAINWATPMSLRGAEFRIWPMPPTHAASWPACRKTLSSLAHGSPSKARWV